MSYRIFSFIMYFLLLVTGIAVFKVKALVHNMQSQHAEIKKQITQELSSVTLLKANFSYLTKPDRIRELSARYLDLNKVNLTQISQNIDKVKQNIKADLSKFAKLPKTSKWRYKHLKNILSNTLSEAKPKNKIKKN